jgi:hypothetical protein
MSTGSNVFFEPLGFFGGYLATARMNDPQQLET